LDDRTIPRIDSDGGIDSGKEIKLGPERKHDNHTSHGNRGTGRVFKPNKNPGLDGNRYGILHNGDLELEGLDDDNGVADAVHRIGNIFNGGYGNVAIR
jgi:hypothetical protein